jgi:L-alanine-DL-glutamate epimerase-like enolase superfamily enzyme
VPRGILVGRDPREPERLRDLTSEDSPDYGREGAAIQATTGVHLTLRNVKSKALDHAVCVLFDCAYNKTRADAGHPFDFESETTGELAGADWPEAEVDLKQLSSTKSS